LIIFSTRPSSCSAILERTYLHLFAVMNNAIGLAVSLVRFQSGVRLQE
jgi:hypothetical protein